MVEEQDRIGSFHVSKDKRLRPSRCCLSAKLAFPNGLVCEPGSWIRVAAVTARPSAVLKTWLQIDKIRFLAHATRVAIFVAKLEHRKAAHCAPFQGFVALWPVSTYRSISVFKRMTWSLRRKSSHILQDILSELFPRRSGHYAGTPLGRDARCVCSRNSKSIYFSRVNDVKFRALRGGG